MKIEEVGGGTYNGWMDGWMEGRDRSSNTESERWNVLEDL